MSTTLHYRHHGQSVRSRVPLPLPSTSGSAVPDVDVVCGEVPPSAVGDGSGFLWCLVGHATLVLTLARLRLAMVAGRQVIVDAPPDSDPHRVGYDVAGLGLAAAALQRDRPILHATLLSRGDRGIALCGPSGTGKSTLALALHQRGFDVRVDDACYLDPADLTWIDVGGGAALRLRADSATAQGLDVSDLPRVPTRLDKHVYGLEPAPAGKVRLREIWLLSRDRGLTEPRVRVEVPVAAAPQLARQFYLPGLARGLRGPGRLLAEAGRLAEQVRVRAVTLPDDLAMLGRTADVLAALPALEPRMPPHGARAEP